MNYLFIAFFIWSSLVYSQDLIVKVDGDSIESKVREIGISEISYHMQDNLDGPLFIIAKKEVANILFENGNTLLLEKNRATELEETKNYIIEHLNKYGYEEDSFKHPFRASFEGNYLKLVEMNEDKSKDKNKGMIYDFSSVYRFRDVIKKSENLAFLNIWVPILRNAKRDKWEKIRLIIRVKGVNEAESILNALKYYNKLLTTKDPSSKF